jgi:hypothetical protein
MRKIVLIALLCLGACSATQVTTTQTDIATACALAPVLDASASVQVKAQVEADCADLAILVPVVAPLVTKP